MGRNTINIKENLNILKQRYKEQGNRIPFITCRQYLRILNSLLFRHGLLKYVGTRYKIYKDNFSNVKQGDIKNKGISIMGEPVIYCPYIPSLNLDDIFKYIGKDVILYYVSETHIKIIEMKNSIGMHLENNEWYIDIKVTSTSGQTTTIIYESAKNIYDDVDIATNRFKLLREKKINKKLDNDCNI
jgi:hypothetical protein